MTADFLQLLDSYGIYRITRLDIQQTTCTKKFLTPWWITAFDVGALRVIGKKFYEPRGKKVSSDDYPSGATIYHGARTSERFARQYDKHKKAEIGPPRRRDEIEIKGDSSRRLWSELMDDLALGEQLGESRGARLHSFSKAAIRAYLPIRDTSRWLGKELPKNWAQLAEEPMNWSELFEVDATTISPAPKRVTHLLKSYRYCMQNFGAAYSVMTAKRVVENKAKGQTPSLEKTRIKGGSGDVQEAEKECSEKSGTSEKPDDGEEGDADSDGGAGCGGEDDDPVQAEARRDRDDDPYRRISTQT